RVARAREAPAADALPLRVLDLEGPVDDDLGRHVRRGSAAPRGRRERLRQGEDPVSHDASARGPRAGAGGAPLRERALPVLGGEARRAGREAVRQPHAAALRRRRRLLLAWSEDPGGDQGGPEPYLIRIFIYFNLFY